MQMSKSIMERKYYYIAHKVQAVEHFFQTFVDSFTSYKYSL